MTLHRATWDDGWQVLRSLDGGIHWTPVGPLFAKGREARALISSIEGDLSPLRHDSDVSPLPGHGRAGELALAGQDKTAT